MKRELFLAVCVGFMTSLVILGMAALVVFSVPQLADNAKYLLPAVLVSLGILAPFLVWRLSPRIRPRY